jgi:hypothetical protein
MGMQFSDIGRPSGIPGVACREAFDGHQKYSLEEKHRMFTVTEGIA